MNSIETQYLTLLQDILDNGTKKSDRTGTGTLSVFGRQLKHNFKDGFPLLTTKNVYFKGIVAELLWFLRGDTSIEYLLENDCNIWVGDCYRNYKQKLAGLQEKAGVKDFEFLTEKSFVDCLKVDDHFMEDWGYGKIYGYQWRFWRKISSVGNMMTSVEHIDQISELIHTLKTNPDSRRMIVSAWNPSDADDQVLPACHTGFQVYTRELTGKERHKLASEYASKNGHWQITYRAHPFTVDQTTGKLSEESQKVWDEETHRAIDARGWNIPKRAISLMYNARSQDVPLGTPFNIASYGLLLQILAKMTNMIPEELIGSLGDCHIYLNQIEGVKEQLKRVPLKFPEISFEPKINFNGTIDNFLDSCNPNDIKLIDYQHHPKIKFPLSN